MVKVYAEGGGNLSTLRRECRRGFKSFFKSAGIQEGLLEIVASGSRQEAFDNFSRGVNEQQSDDILLLLVDSEAPVESGVTVWNHLASVEGSRWKRPRGITDDQAFLMVQCMEAWFLADRDALKSYFGQYFNESAFKKWRDIETVAKPRVFDALKRVTSGCSKPYTKATKGKLSFELLGMIDPSKVQDASPHVRELLDRLAELTTKHGG